MSFRPGVTATGITLRTAVLHRATRYLGSPPAVQHIVRSLVEASANVRSNAILAFIGRVVHVERLVDVN